MALVDPSFPPPPRLALLLDELLEELAKEGFPRAGITLRLHLAQLLGGLSDRVLPTPEHLKYQLAALCCHSAEEQAKFYRLFDEFVLRNQVENAEPEPPTVLPTVGPPEKPEEIKPDANPIINDILQQPPVNRPATLPPTARSGPIALELTFYDDGFRPWNLPEIEPIVRAWREKEWTIAEEWDIPASIRRTIRAGGLPQFSRRRRRKAPQYLFLIEQKSPRDHLAALFADLVLELQRRDVDADYYFYGYGTELHHCWKDRRNPASYVTIEQLLSGHAGGRLIVVGEPESLLHLPDLRPTALALQMRDDWPAVALLCTRSTAAWDAPEAALSRLFPVAPASLAGLGSLLSQWTNRLSYTRTYWQWIASEPIVPDFSQMAGNPADLPKLLRSLKAYLGKQGFNWLCAVAVYPELYWPLTKLLHDEAVPHTEVPDEGLRRQVWLFALRRLVRLEWLRQGGLPTKVALELRKLLPPETAMSVRTELLKVLGLDENKKLPDQSYARQDRAYTVALLELEQAVAQPELTDSQRIALEAAFRERVEREQISLTDIANAVGREALQKLLSLAPPADSQAFQVLWVDDKPQTNESFQKTLKEQLDIEFVNVSSTEEALQILNRRSFHLIISDTKRLDDVRAGIKMMQIFVEKQIGIPVMFSTTQVSADRCRDELMQLGAVAVLTNRKQEQEFIEARIKRQTPPPANPDYARPTSAADHPGFQVLWVDDEPKNNERFQDELNELLHGVFTNVRSTEEALTTLASGQPFDLIVSDVSRRRRDDEGTKMLQAFREKEIAVPVIFYTTPAMAEQRGGELRELGAAGVFSSHQEVRRFMSEQVMKKQQQANDLFSSAPYEGVAQSQSQQSASSPNERITDDKITQSISLFSSPIKMFIAYSGEDRSYLEAFKRHIVVLTKGTDPVFTIWSDQDMTPGEEWDIMIKQQIESAEFIVLLVSAHSLNSNYFDVSMRSMQAVVVPIIMSPCLWTETFLKDMQVLPDSGKPISTYTNQDIAWAEVVRRLKERADDFNRQRHELDTRIADAKKFQNSGDAALKNKNYEAANAAYQQALNLFTDLKDDTGRANAHNALGKLYVATNDLENALQHFKSASTLYLGLNFNPAYAYALMDMGSVQRKLGRLEEAQQSYEEAWVILEELGNEKDLVDVHYALGSIAYEQRKYTHAIQSFENALELTLNLDNNVMEAAIRRNLGLTYQETGNLSRAADEFQRALEIYVATDDKDRIMEIEKSIELLKQKLAPPKNQAGSKGKTKEKIQSLIANNETEEALTLLAKLNGDALLLQAQFNNGKKNFNLGLIDFSEWQRIQARVNYGALEIAGKLDTNENLGTVEETPENLDRNITGDKEGMIAYYIPATMEVGKTTLCTARITFNKEAVQINPADLLQSIRLTDKLSVELEQGAENETEDEVFDIDNKSSVTQTIKESGYTTWEFKVEPQRIGTYRLVLKITLFKKDDQQSTQLLERQVVVTDKPYSQTQKKAPMRKRK